ncbi:hypothetical protein T01_13295 [Trichinella spiralis]|uniref:Uncharacterized protein n=1 Tax=Trichinella spiralis TaxID=6334 RepID=A0A0V1BS98_TRISP|nr:hypothetical protein T01_13295 [Trichinella spiralis]
MYQHIISIGGEWPMGVDCGNPGKAPVRAVNGKLTELKFPQFSVEVLEFPTFWVQSHYGNNK